MGISPCSTPRWARAIPRSCTFLLTSGRFDPNDTTGAGETPLHAAVRVSRPDMVCHLIAHGAQPHLSNRDSHTPLDLARALSDPDLAALIEGDSCLPAK